MKLVVLDAKTLGSISFEPLNQFGEVTLYPTTQEHEVLERIKGYDIVLSNKVMLKGETLSQAGNIKLIVVLATGYNNVDIPYCKEHNIAVCNVSGYSTQTVTQQTVALLLELYNKIHLFDQYIKSGTYSTSGLFTCVGGMYDIHDISGKRWTIVGLGAIGKSVARVAQAFGADVKYYSTTGNHDDSDFTRVSFDEMVKESDIISIHCPLNEKTKGMFNYEMLKQMKSSVVIINVARGPVVVCEDMVKALNEQLIGGYATDVFDKEPIEKDNLYLTVDPSKIVMSPHIGWATVEARERLFAEVIKNIVAFLNNEKRNRIV